VKPPSAEYSVPSNRSQPAKSELCDKKSEFCCKKKKKIEKDTDISGKFFRKLLNLAENGSTITPGQLFRSQHDHGLLSRREALSEFIGTIQQIFNDRWVLTKVLYKKYIQLYSTVFGSIISTKGYNKISLMYSLKYDIYKFYK
jgi:hypothetical protein